MGCGPSQQHEVFAQSYKQIAGHGPLVSPKDVSGDHVLREPGAGD